MIRSAAIVLASLAVLAPATARADNWPQWRGPELNGVSKETGLPAEWAEGKNVAWTLKLPGRSGATPAVWGRRIFLTAQDANKELHLLCVGTDGKELWSRKVAALGKSRPGYMRDEGDNASPSPCTDGRHVYAFFGTGDFVCFDVDGKPVWQFNAQERYGAFKIMHGMHVSPLLHGDRLYLSLLHEGAMWVVALDKATGKEVWKVERPTDGDFEGRHSYASPVLWRDGKDAYLVVHGCDYTTAHQLSDGAELWRLTGLNPIAPGRRYDRTLRFVASPAAAPDLIVVPTAKLGPVVAVKPSARGRITPGGDGELWRRPKNTPDVPSPLIDGDLVYLCRERGMLEVVDKKTGQDVYTHQLHQDRYRASPVLADGKLYLTSRDGTVSVVKAGPKFELLAENKLPDQLAASPAIADGRIYLRSFQALYAISTGGK